MANAIPRRTRLAVILPAAAVMFVGLISISGVAALVSFGQRDHVRLVQSAAREKQLLDGIKEMQAIAARWEKIAMDAIATARTWKETAEQRQDDTNVCRSMLAPELRERL